MNNIGKTCVCTAALLTVVAALIQSPGNAQAAPGDTPAATYSGGTLRVTIPFRGLHPGAGQFTVEVLDPEDKVLGRAERSVDPAQGKGTWREEIALTPAPSIDDLVWHRVHYRFLYADQKSAVLESTDSISEILRMPVVHILGQQSYLAGGTAAIRVIVTDSKNEIITGAGTVRIDLMAPNDHPRALYTGRLNRRGTTEAQFRFPAGLTGRYPIRYVVDTAIGSAEYTQQVQLEEKASILLTTEKPIYQPGQTIHVRALALDRANHEAVASRRLTLELEDSRGNKVFKKITQTDTYGVASAEFTLADEVNLGTYHLRALMDSNTAELALNVERYVLPKFKVAVEFAKDSHGKRGYRPGDHVTGTVRANYFFGKPVDGAEITVKGSVLDVAMADAGNVQGNTDSDGAYRFDLKLPAYFAGLPLNHGAARVLIEATVKDSAGHAETRGEPITVSEYPLLVTAIPEGGTLVPNLDNQIFILASYPDGTPAKANLKIQAPGDADQSAQTDAGGVAVIRVNVGQASRPVPLQLEATDAEGNRSSTLIPLAQRQGEDQILLRTERAVYRAGDRILLKVFSTKTRGTAYIDAVKNGQTVLTRDLDLVDGAAELTLPATPDLAGTVDFNAYQFGRDARPVADHRLVFVHPADELKIEASTDAPVYKPGDEARLHFRVTNTRGEGVQAAVGLQIVDEAVFALAEKRPGFAKVFFYLEQELMKPRYEIHSIGLPDIVEPVSSANADQRDRAARALFAATEIVRGNRFETETGRTIPQAKRAEYIGRYTARFQTRVQQIAANLTRAYQQNRNAGELTRVAANSDLRDAWAIAMRVEHLDWDSQRRYYAIRSAGPDKQFNTVDDLYATLEVRTRQIPGPPLASEMSVDLQLEHDRGPFNGRAEVVGSVKDTRGAAVPGATVTAHEAGAGTARTAATNAAGQFTLTGLAPGDYQIKVSAPGFKIASRPVTLQVRDRAVLTAVLNIGPMLERVEVAVSNPAPRRITIGGNVRLMDGPMRGVAGGVIGGFAGGAPGGVLGGIIGSVPSVAPRQFDAAMLTAPPPPPPPVKKEMASTERTAAPRVRSYFPEALYINPEIVTDRDGRASITIRLADNITTWRMAMLASTTHGALGSGVGSLKVFQDFFVDLDLPVTLTQGDRVSLPVAAYNYSGAAGNVSLQLQPDDWFALVDDVPAKSLAVESGRVGGSQFTVEAKRIGKFKLTLSARLSGSVNRADIVVREIEVVPNGRERNLVFNGRLESTVRHEVTFPSASIPEASKVFVRLYPGPLSQVIEGMDSILRMPGGCFEQTSSSTYPNVLALDYMKRAKKLTPEVHAKAEGYIANGYQRLLTFEVPGGGFSWFGSAPANKILTAYGLMEFFDMSQVYDVDPKLIQRTQQWLAAQQQADGSWKPDLNFINEGATNRYNSDLLRITAYLAWSLENTGYQGPAIERARQFVEGHMSGNIDTYTLAVIANFAADGKNREFTSRAMQLLLAARAGKDEQSWWTAEETGVYGRGASAAVETTGLAVQALLKWGGDSATASKALAWLASKKDASGTWGTTQATIMALRAILLSTGKGAADVRGTVEITLNGKTVETLRLTADNNDLLHQFALKNVDSRGANAVELRFTGKGALAYQVVGRHFVPWDERPANEPLSITVNYDRTTMAQNDIASATATVKSNLRQAANMVIVDLGIPPGFDLLSEDLQAFQEKTAAQKGGRLEKFSLTATQAILYFDAIPTRGTITLSYRLRAKYPIRARTFQSRVYEYYQPEVNSVARPQQLEVR